MKRMVSLPSGAVCTGKAAEMKLGFCLFSASLRIWYTRKLRCCKNTGGCAITDGTMRNQVGQTMWSVSFKELSDWLPPSEAIKCASLSKYNASAMVVVLC